EDCIRAFHVTGVQTCALPIYRPQGDRALSRHPRQIPPVGRQGTLSRRCHRPLVAKRQLGGSAAWRDRTLTPSWTGRCGACRAARSEERRVGKESKARGSTEIV